jgi:hypothetical protein
MSCTLEIPWVDVFKIDPYVHFSPDRIDDLCNEMRNINFFDYIFQWANSELNDYLHSVEMNWNHYFFEKDVNVFDLFVSFHSFLTSILNDIITFYIMNWKKMGADSLREFYKVRKTLLKTLVGMEMDMQELLLNIVINEKGLCFHKVEITTRYVCEKDFLEQTKKTDGEYKNPCHIKSTTTHFCF